VVRNLPAGPQLRSACFQSTNYTYAGHKVRRSAFYPCHLLPGITIINASYQCLVPHNHAGNGGNVAYHL